MKIIRNVFYGIKGKLFYLDLSVKEKDLLEGIIRIKHLSFNHIIINPMNIPYEKCLCRIKESKKTAYILTSKEYDRILSEGSKEIRNFLVRYDYFNCGISINDKYPMLGQINSRLKDENMEVMRPGIDLYNTLIKAEGKKLKELKLSNYIRQQHVNDKKQEELSNLVISIISHDIYSTGFTVDVAMNTQVSMENKRNILNSYTKEFLQLICDKIRKKYYLNRKIGSLDFYKPTEVILINSGTYAVVRFNVKKEVNNEI